MPSVEEEAEARSPPPKLPNSISRPLSHALIIPHSCRMQPLFFFLLLLSLLFPSLALLGPEPLAAERSALLRFKTSTRSDPLGLLSQWSSSSDHHHCSWPGVACDASSRVVALNVSARPPARPDPLPCSRPGPFRRACPDPTRRLTGQLTPALGDLTELRILSLPFHSFDGQIPGEIWGLENLQAIDLEGNSLSGTLASASRFPKTLRVLNLASNLITGEIPLSLSACVSLETLDLSGNRINGSIPEFVGSFGRLRELYLSFNRIGSSIPEKIGNCRSLEVLDLSGNLLVREIPRNLGNCSELRHLLLFSNLLDDAIPSDLGRLRKLRVLDVSRNSLSGAVPAELGNCVELTVLVLSNQYDPMPSVDSSNYVDNDEFNYFQGGISEKITALPKLRILWAPRTTLEGELPKDWGACMSLEIVNLGENLFTGEIPTGFGGCKNLKHLNLSSNNLTGWLRDELPVPCMTVFDISGNKLSGTIPRSIYKQCPPSPFPPDDLPALYSSFFAYRTRKGIALPSSFESAGSLAVYHNFGRNKFVGGMPPISPDRFGNQTVYAFLADGNSLVGSLSDALSGKCNYFNGLFLNLSNNLISGALPADLGAMCRSLIILDVAGNKITGSIPQIVGSLGSLVGLDLSMNRLQGQIPVDFAELKGLNYLNLARNNLSGHVPSAFDQLLSLQLLDLSSNSLTGEIPGGLVTLKNLTILLLNNNKLSGKIPSGFANVTALSMFNVSYNNLSGPLPLNAGTLRCDSVLGNPLLQSCRVSSLAIPPSYLQGQSGDLQSYTYPPPGISSPRGTSNGFSSIEIASVTSASAIVAVLLALIILYIVTRKCTPGSRANSLGRWEVIIFVDIGVSLTYESVVRATGSFNASNCIGSGGFGATYKAEVSPGVLVAIKRLSVGRIQGVQQFHAEIKTLGRWRHPNLVTLIGYHIGDVEMFLVYNYLPGGNLERFIQERSRRAVDWRMLHKIALDVAKALAYLHDQCVPRILHRDVKPSNILLDNDFNAYLSDFGLARLLGNSETHATTGVAGTFGYVAPEYAMTCRVSDKADVYSYGIVLLELISDKKALDPSFSPYGNGFNIVAWACMLLGQGRAREFFTDGLWEVAPHDDLVETLRLAVKCTVESLSVRPTMNQVVRRLRELKPPSYSI